MKRTGTTRMVRFVKENQRLLLFLLLPIGGCLCGLLLYGAVSAAEWITLVEIRPVPVGIGQVFSQLFESCFQPILLLAILFVSGLSACGIPAALAVPVFWGMGVGLTQACYYAEGWGGVAVVAAVLLPHSVMEAVVLLMAASECFRMSVRFAVQLLPRSAHCGGLWQDFRLYAVRFLLLLLLLFVAGALDVGMRLLCVGWLK